MASTYLSRSISSTGNRQTWTYSAWIKKNTTGDGYLLSANDGSNYSTISFSNGALRYYDFYSSAVQAELKTNRVFRDTNAWYHIVVRYDTTQSTADDRIRFYVNGVQETSMATRNNPSSTSWESYFNFSGDTNYINREGASSTIMDCCMSHIHFTDGYSYAPTEFGETDSTTGEWKIKTSPSVSYGTNGYWILKDGNSVTDQSGQGNNFTVGGGTLTKTEDCPSNVFATFNPLYNSGGTVTYSNGNTKFEEADNQWKTTFSTLSAASGKYYAEFKCNGNYMMIGVADMTRTFYGIADRNFASTTFISEQGYGYYNGNGDLYYRGSSASHGDTYANGDIIQVALDCDNNRLFFGKNGTWQNSADPTTASTGIQMNATNARYAFAAAVQQDQIHANFGNGYFSTTAVASAGTNASGNGIFEYNVPTGYTALSTKGLNL